MEMVSILTRNVNQRIIHPISQQESIPERGNQIGLKWKLLATFEKEGQIGRKWISVVDNTLS